jgi:2-methylcitrate dehydratase
MLCEMEVVMRSGATHHATVEYHKGHYRNPMSEAQIEQKFGKLAERVLPAAAVDRLLARLWTLESADDIGEVARLSVAP